MYMHVFSFQCYLNYMCERSNVLKGETVPEGILIRLVKYEVALMEFILCMHRKCCSFLQKLLQYLLSNALFR